jgi:peptidoglycan hydrolase CwlO-like protein
VTSLDARVCVLLVVGYTLFKEKRGREMANYLPVIISALALSFSIYMGIRNNRKDDAKDITDKVERDTKINCKLDEISSDVKDIKFDISATKNKVDDIDKRLVVVEQSTKSAHHRIDRIEGKETRKDT